MAQNVTLNGTTYSTPDIGESYGASFTNYLRAISTDCLTKDGGTRTLLADLNLGANYGLVARYFKSNALTISTAGIIRLGNNESIGWRNAGNTTNYELKVNASNVLEFNGNPVFTLALGAVDTVLRMNSAGTAYEYAKLQNANIATAAAIDATKIHDGSVDNTEFSYLNGVTSSIQTQLNAKLDDVSVATDNALVRFDTNGQALQNSTVIVDDSGNMSGVANITTSGNIDKASAASLDIGGTNATTINLGRSGQTTVIKGNLQVDGTTTTVNSTTMEVADANIRVNNGGNDASAEGAGLTVEGTSNSDLATIQYATALVSKFKAGASGSESEIMTVGTAQTITGVKTFDEELVLKHNATPTTPSSGYVKTYVKSDNKAYILDSSGNEVPLGSSTGAGEVNINTNPNADSGYDLNGTNDVGDWIDSGTGTTVSKTTTSSEIPLYPIRTSGIKIVNDGSGTGYTRLRMILPESLENTKLKIQWNQLYSTSTAYASGDFKVEMYSYTDSAFSVAETELALSTDSSGTSSIPALNGRFTTTFDSTTANYLEMRITRVAGSANSYIALNDVIIGPGIQPQGAVVGKPEAVTFSLSNLGNATVNGFRTQVGEEAVYKGTITIGSSLPTGTLRLGLPSGDVINTSAHPTGGYVKTGYVSAINSGVTTHFGQVMWDTASMVFTGDDGAGVWNATVPMTFVAGDVLQFEMRVALTRWAGSGTVNLAQNDVEYAYNTDVSSTASVTSSGFGYGPVPSTTNFGSGWAVGTAYTRRVRFQSPRQITDKIDIELSSDQGVTWISAMDVFPRIFQSSTQYGIGTAPVAGTLTDFDVIFTSGGSFSSSATYGNNGTPWSNYYDVSNNYKWRVKKTSAGVATGWGRATETASGLAPQGVFKSGLSNTIALQPLTVTPQNPNTSSDGHIYIKGSKLIIQFNDAGTIRYKYLDLTSTGVTWVHTTVAP